jgi:hypothetical protein
LRYKCAAGHVRPFVDGRCQCCSSYARDDDNFFMLVSPRARREGMRPAEGCELPSVPCWMIVY